MYTLPEFTITESTVLGLYLRFPSAEIAVTRCPWNLTATAQVMQVPPMMRNLYLRPLVTLNSERGRLKLPF